jgi:hypothetical protein
MDQSKCFVDWHKEIDTGSTTFVVPDDIPDIFLEGIGGGGGGGNGMGGASSQGGGGGGGGGAGSWERIALNNVAGKTLNITIGTGGSAGNPGTATLITIDGVLRASFSGGKAGASGSTLTYGAGGKAKWMDGGGNGESFIYLGPGGGGSNGATNNVSTVDGGDTPGATGGHVGTPSSSFCLGGAGGAGGASPYAVGGNGGRGGDVNIGNAESGTNGTYGSGGGGGGGGWCNVVGGTSPAGNGGNGGNGKLIIMYLKQ